MGWRAPACIPFKNSPPRLVGLAWPPPCQSTTPSSSACPLAHPTVHHDGLSLAVSMLGPWFGTSLACLLSSIRCCASRASPRIHLVDHRLLSLTAASQTHSPIPCLLVDSTGPPGCSKRCCPVSILIHCRSKEALHSRPACLTVSQSAGSHPSEGEERTATFMCLEVE